MKMKIVLKEPIQLAFYQVIPLCGHLEHCKWLAGRVRPDRKKVNYDKFQPLMICTMEEDGLGVNISPSKQPPEVMAALKIVASMFSKGPKKRIQSAEALAFWLDDVFGKAGFDHLGFVDTSNLH